jgi:hypothetical protein
VRALTIQSQNRIALLGESGGKSKDATTVSFDCFSKNNSLNLSTLIALKKVFLKMFETLLK